MQGGRRTSRNWGVPVVLGVLCWVGLVSAEPPRVRTVSRAKDTGLARYKVRPAVLGGNSNFDSTVERKARELGAAIGKRALPLATGGGGGTPLIAAKEAKALGSLTVGFSPAASIEDHARRGRPMGEVLSTVYTSNAPGTAGIIEREGPLIQQTNARIYINGNLGTLGEFVAALHEPGVVARVKGSGGVADAMIRFLPHLGKLRSDIRFVSSANPERLVRRAVAEVEKLPALASMPKQLAEPIGERSLLTLSERAGEVYSLLVSANGMNPGQRREAEKLVDLVGGAKDGAGAPLTVVMPKRSDRFASALAQRLRDLSANVVEIDSGGSYQPVATATPVRSLGLGKGAGEFMAQRQVVGAAKAVYVAGGDYKTLAGVVFALHQPAVIGVLESGGLSSGLKEILAIANKNPGGATLIYEKDAGALQQKVQGALDRRSRASTPGASPRPSGGLAGFFSWVFGG